VSSVRAVAKGCDASRYDEGGDASWRYGPDDDDASWRYGPWSPSIALDIPLSLGDNVSPLKRVFSGRSQAPSGAQQHMHQHMLSGHASHGPAAGRGEACHAGGGTGRGVEIELGRGGYRGRRHGTARARALARERGRGGGLAERWINYFTGDYVSEAQQRQALLLIQAQTALFPPALALRALPARSGEGLGMLARPCWRVTFSRSVVTSSKCQGSSNIWQLDRCPLISLLISYLCSHIFLTSGVGGVGGVGDRRLRAIGGVQGYYAATAAESEWRNAVLVLLRVRKRGCVHCHAGAGVMC
jgi:hypothetical protein